MVAYNRSNITKAGENVTSAVRPRLRKHPIFVKRAGSHNSLSPAPFFLSGLVIVIASAVLITAGMLLSVSTGEQSFHQLEDGVVNGASIQAPGTATEGQSSRLSKGDKIKIGGCVLLSVLIIGVISLIVLQEEREIINNKC